MMRTMPGRPYPLGATWDGMGVNFALFSESASGVELCLFDSIDALKESRRILEQHLGRPVRYLAWPCGWYNDTLVRMAVDTGYEVLLTVKQGVNRPGQDLRYVRRTCVNGACDLAVFAKQLRDGRYRVAGSSSEERVRL